VPFPLPKASSKREHLRAEILAMLKKGAIERVLNKSSPGFYSLLFVIPQKERETSLGHRSSIIESPHKKGEVSHGNTCKSAPLHSKREWVISVDFKFIIIWTTGP